MASDDINARVRAAPTRVTPSIRRSLRKNAASAAVSTRPAPADATHSTVINDPCHSADMQLYWKEDICLMGTMGVSPAHDASYMLCSMFVSIHTKISG